MVFEAAADCAQPLESDDVPCSIGAAMGISLGLEVQLGFALDGFVTLSERFILALCTNPPTPFVGELDLPVVLLSPLCEDDGIVEPLNAGCSPFVVGMAVRSDIGDALTCAWSSAMSD